MITFVVRDVVQGKLLCPELGLNTEAYFDFYM